MQATAVILAAGLGTRMKSCVPKTLHRLAGRTMLRHLLSSCEPVFDRIVVVLGPGMDAVRKEAEPHICVVQEQRLGTAHAALQALEHFGDGHVAVLYADNPLIRTATLRRLLASHTLQGLSLLAFRAANPGRYGRVITGTDALVERIVEYADASAAERAVNLCNAGVLCARRRRDAPLAAGGAQRQREGGILSHRRRRPRQSRRAAGCSGRGAGGRTGRGQRPRRTGPRRGRAARLDARQLRWRRV